MNAYLYNNIYYVPKATSPSNSIDQIIDELLLDEPASSTSLAYL